MSAGSTSNIEYATFSVVITSNFFSPWLAGVSVKWEHYFHKSLKCKLSFLEITAESPSQIYLPRFESTETFLFPTLFQQVLRHDQKRMLLFFFFNIKTKYSLNFFFFKCCISHCGGALVSAGWASSWQSFCRRPGVPARWVLAAGCAEHCSVPFRGVSWEVGFSHVYAPETTSVESLNS